MYLRVHPWFCAPVRFAPVNIPVRKLANISTSAKIYSPVRIIYFWTTLVLGHRNQISHPSGNLEKKRHDLPPVSFGKASSPQLVLDSSLGHRDRAVRVQVFIVLGFVVAIPFCWYFSFWLFLLRSNPSRENLIGENLTVWVNVLFKIYVCIFFFTTLSFLYPNN